METTTNGTSFSNQKFTSPAVSDVEQQQATMELEPTTDFNYSKRSQWLRAAILGANDGLVSTASLMMGVGAVKQDIKAMILTGFAGLVAGACSMAIGEFVSVYSQLDIELAQMKRDKQRDENRQTSDEEEEKGKEGEKESLPNPLQASAASALAFSVGAMVPLLAASFIKEYNVRVGAVIGAVSLALLVFGWLGAMLGKAPTVRSAVRVLIGGWLAMAITFGLTKLIGSSGL
ncbi:Vacuolar iron transporter-like protein 2 [Hibiscus syriacus]|uniref:Vacuolar iron transporter n=1 Tax=Hibiscus syriacus TaxID=106335 RepID=A0A6A3AF57_HIBSY|nr:vacuolar iron transporter homolog 4-like [Hibiscus syriacus]KAE8701815.1 Vacuolar iron transporter-like protein 2 [Hibiscus syriacus]